MLEDRVSFAMQGQGDSTALDQSLHEKEQPLVSSSEQRVRNGVGGIIAASSRANLGPRSPAHRWWPLSIWTNIPF